MCRENGPGRYDFILMDIQMPVMNGYESARAIRALPGGRDVPIIAFSANAFKEDRGRSLAAGMNEHLPKPIVVSDLIACLKRYI